MQVYHGTDSNGNTYSTLYAHMNSAPVVSVGQPVSKGQLLGYVGSNWAWIGLLPLLTGLFRFCPAYKLIGANTCPMKK